VIRSLLQGGMSLQRVRRAITYLRKRAALDEHLSEVKLVTDGKSIFQLCRTEGEIIDALKEGQMAFFVAIDSIARSVDRNVSQFLYDREEFVSALQQVETDLGRELEGQDQRRYESDLGGAAPEPEPALRRSDRVEALP
jgi:hypothetical protein